MIRSARPFADLDHLDSKLIVNHFIDKAIAGGALLDFVPVRGPAQAVAGDMRLLKALDEFFLNCCRIVAPSLRHSFRAD